MNQNVNELAPSTVELIKFADRIARLEEFKSRSEPIILEQVRTMSRLETMMQHMIETNVEIKETLKDIRSDISEVKSDISGVKSDISILKTDVSNLKSDVSMLKKLGWGAVIVSLGFLASSFLRAKGLM